MAFDTGHGATATVVGSTAYSWTSIEVGSYSIPTVDTSHLGTTDFRAKIPGDCIDPGSVTLSFVYAAATALVDAGTSGTTTINLPGGGSISGDSFVESVDYPSLETDGLQTGSITITWEETPTYT